MGNWNRYRNSVMPRTGIAIWAFREIVKSRRKERLQAILLP